MSNRSVYLITLSMGRLSLLSGWPVPVLSLLPETDNRPSWISGRERLTVENIEWWMSSKYFLRSLVPFHWQSRKYFIAYVSHATLIRLLYRPRWLSWMRVRLETRRSRVRSPPRSATFFRGDWSWNIFYGHSLPSADSRRAVISVWRKNVHKTG